MLTRSGFAGLQRYSAIWTGDNRAEEDHMLLGVRLLNSLGVSGIPFTGMDVGGFLGVPTPSLYARWMQIGAFNPYFRNHSAYNNKSAEPWAFGESVLDISRNYVNLRYRLMPYLYSAFYDAAQSGEPVMRTLAIDYTHDAKVYDQAYQNQYLFGKSFMVAPFESTKEFGKVYFPAGKWYNLHTDAVQQGGQEAIAELSIQQLPVYVKESSIVPVQSLVQSTSEKPDGTLALHIYKGDVDSSTVYYEDDGASFAYEKGDYYKRTIDYNAAKRSITLGKVQGKSKSKFDKLAVILHGFGDQPALKINGKEVKPVPGKFGFTPEGQVAVSSAVTDNHGSMIVISY
jgi:alpha-glucosidase